MESVKILHTGDIHLFSPMLNMGEKAEQRKKELLKSFSNTIDLAIEEKVDMILIAGDMFETSCPDQQTLDYVSKEFERISNIKVFIVRGNHDCRLDFKFPENVHLFDNYLEKVNVGDADVYGVSFDDDNITRCMIEGLTAENTDKINLLVVHGEIKSRSIFNPITEENISYSKMDYIALGHVHSHGGFLKSGVTTYCYCGVPEGRAFDECGEKGVVIAEVGRGYANCRFVPMCIRQYLCKTVDISNAEDNLQIAQQIASQLDEKENAYKITLTGVKKTFVDLEFLKEFLEKEFYFTELEDESEENTDDEFSLKNLFVKNCDNEDALKYGLTALRGDKVVIE